MQKRFTVFGFLFLLTPLYGQSGPTLIGAGYSLPTELMVAPGQIVRLQVTGLKTVVPQGFQQATSVPLPTSIAGISVKVNQYLQDSLAGPPRELPLGNAPIVSISQVSLCAASTPDCLATYITAQIPSGLLVQVGVPPIILTTLVISENGVDSQEFAVAAGYDAIHVITTCEGRTLLITSPEQRTCLSVVTHSDGTLVSTDSPAEPNEVVTIYAWGLGPTTPSVAAGNVTPDTAPILSIPGYPNGLVVRFDFRPDAPASFLYPTPPITSAKAYLTPGEVGLYQINVQLPDQFPQIAPCTPLFGGLLNSIGILSNLTITLQGPYSFDGARICVQPTQ